jgi:NADPH:quinone reductase-like Zn-dependent oxidoreductase
VLECGEITERKKAMKALVLEKPGSPDTLKIAEQPLPDPAPGEVRVRVMAVGLNPVDYKTAEWGWPSWKWPHILGLDVAGKIDSVGTNIKSWKPGDRVFYHGDLSKPGGYAEFAIAPAHIITRIPDNVTFEEAAAIPCAGYTAWQILSRKIPARQGQALLVHGGAGGVGGFAIQLGRIQNLKIITTCSAANFSAVKDLGVLHPIDYRSEDVTARVMEITNGRGVDIVINTIDSASATEDIKRLAFGGHLACVAGLPDFGQIEPFTCAISIHESALGGAHLSGDKVAQADLAEMGKELIELVQDEKITSMLSRVISLEEIPKALNDLSKRHVKGKIVARPGY